jgi:outer membrane protein assembly factor BamE (lipoprotein component of BamABCDE complex)
MKLWKTLALVAATALSLSACDMQKASKLEEGVSTEADVRKQFGEPQSTFTNPDGSRTFEYTRQPAGQTNYFITIGSDGKMTSLRQVLKPSEFAKITPGLNKDEARKILGRPAKSIRYDLKPNEENWEWRWLDGQDAKLFIATFDNDGKVIKTQSIDDPAAMPGGK